MICLKGARDICLAVGENPKQISSLVKYQGLPAWKRNGSGSWRALPEDLYVWVRKQRDRNIGDYLPADSFADKDDGYAEEGVKRYRYKSQVMPNADDD